MRRGWANRHDAGGWSSKYPARKSGAQERIALIQTEDIEIVRLFLSRTAIVYQRRYTQARQSLSRSHSFGPSLMVTNSVPMCWLTLSVRSDDDGAGPKSCRSWWASGAALWGLAVALSGVSRHGFMVASLIGRSGSSAFRLSTTAVSMSLAGSCFSSESAPRPFHDGSRRQGGTIYWTALPSDERRVQATKRTHLIHRPARDIIPPCGGARVFSYRN